jgi:TonB family protein
MLLNLALSFALTSPFGMAQKRKPQRPPAKKIIETGTIEEKFIITADDCAASKPVESCSINLDAPIPKTSCEFGIVDLICAGCKKGKVKSILPPCYPAIARAGKASGKVVVKIVIDERGKVIWAQIVSGHPLLRLPALRAACHIQFEPYVCNGRVVKAIDYISYTFEMP